MMNTRARKRAARIAAEDVAREHRVREMSEHVSLAVSSVYGLAPVTARTARSFDGHTPMIVNRSGDANFRGQGAGGCGRSRMGRSERTRGGGLSFQRDRNANASRGLIHESYDFTPDYSSDAVTAPLPQSFTSDDFDAMREHARSGLRLALDARDALRAKGEATAAMLAARTK